MAKGFLNKLYTLISFTRNIRTTGAIYETSPDVERAMCAHVDGVDGRVYVEFGLGHGNITQQILESMGNAAKLYSFELNNSFIKYVKTSIVDNRLVIINADARLANQYFDEAIDGIICSIPISMMSSADREQFFSNSEAMLKHGSVLTIVQYSKKILIDLKKYFHRIEIEKQPNLPAAFIFHCYKT